MTKIVDINTKRKPNEGEQIEYYGYGPYSNSIANVFMEKQLESFHVYIKGLEEEVERDGEISLYELMSICEFACTNKIFFDMQELNFLCRTEEAFLHTIEEEQDNMLVDELTILRKHVALLNDIILERSYAYAMIGSMKEGD